MADHRLSVIFTPPVLSSLFPLKRHIMVMMYHALLRPTVPMACIYCLLMTACVCACVCVCVCERAYVWATSLTHWGNVHLFISQANPPPIIVNADSLDAGPYVSICFMLSAPPGVPACLTACHMELSPSNLSQFTWDNNNKNMHRLNDSRCGL